MSDVPARRSGAPTASEAAAFANTASVNTDLVNDAPGPPRPVVLVAHGSPDPRSPEAVRAIARAAEAGVGFLEFNEPHPVEVLTALADKGFSAAVALPLLLTDAYHSRTDLPEVARRAEEARPGFKVAVGRPVGDPELAEALIRDLPDRTGADGSAANGDGATGGAAETAAAQDIDGLVVLAAGTRVDSGRAHVQRVAAEAARRLALRRKRNGLDPIAVHGEAGFASGPGFSAAEAVADLRARGARKIAAVCYFIAPGLLCDKAIESAREAGVVHVGDPLGTAPELIELIRTRAVSA